MLKYIKNLFDSFKLISLDDWVNSNLEATTNGVPLTKKDLESFYESWVYVECICQLHVKEGDNIVVCNFSCIYTNFY